MLRVAIALAFATVSASTSDAQAAETEETKLEWNPAYRPATTAEGVAGMTATAGGFALFLFGPTPPDNWRGGILFDESVRKAVKVGDRTQLVIQRTTDVLFYGTFAYATFDAIGYAGGVKGSWEVAKQMAFIDFESFGVAAITLWGTQLFVGRSRPQTSDCLATGAQDCPMDRETRRSFYAGHPATVIAAAGLTCLHHSRLDVYGGGTADDVACGSMVAAGALTAVGRILADVHYTSDVIVGMSIGVFAGWILPRALHYGWSDAPKPGTRAEGIPVQLTAMPELNPSYLGLRVAALM